MHTKHLLAFALAAAVAAATPVVPAAAGKARPAPNPEAADKTYGMAILAATVSAGGPLERGAGAVSSANVPALGEASYEVLFNRPVHHCFYSVTPSVSLGETHIATAAPRAGTENGVLVQIRDENGNQLPYLFNLLVYCAG
ncbi:hypothetical protein [Microbaculum marinum]|uniref:Uncharacterized protein n=1 Tax=Microbaculum marinum TaxID=1764581 RepID=A0AAW9RSP5_9HYPH